MSGTHNQNICNCGASVHKDPSAEFGESNPHLFSGNLYRLFSRQKKKKITIFHLQLILPQKLWPISGLEAIYRWKTPFPRSLLSILSFFCKGTFAKYTFGNLCTESLSLSSRVTEVTSEVFKIKLEVWLHGYSYWGGEQVKSRNEIYPEKETVLLDFALKHLY